jgi:RalA-binding protein 1
MTLQNVSIVLSPTMQISHRVLHALFTLAHQIFKDTYLKKLVASPILHGSWQDL